MGAKCVAQGRDTVLPLAVSWIPFPFPSADPASRLRAIAKAADSISFGDVVNNVLRRSQNWGLMPFAGVMSCLLPAAYMRGSREIFGLYPNEMNFPRCEVARARAFKRISKLSRIADRARSRQGRSTLSDVLRSIRSWERQPG
jgi:hypothetical protein